MFVALVTDRFYHLFSTGTHRQANTQVSLVEQTHLLAQQLACVPRALHKYSLYRTAGLLYHSVSCSVCAMYPNQQLPPFSLCTIVSCIVSYSCTICASNTFFVALFPGPTQLSVASSSRAGRAWERGYFLHNC